MATVKFDLTSIFSFKYIDSEHHSNNIMRLSLFKYHKAISIYI